MSDPKTYGDLFSATSSPELADGPTPPVLPVGLTTSLCGPARAPANPSPSPDSTKASRTSAISGRTSLTSSVPTGPLSSWESRLRERLAMVGSTEYRLIWKAKTTPQGRSMFQLAPSMPHTSGSDCTGWPTPATRDHKGGYQGGRIRNGKISNDTLDVTVQHTVALWPTPAAADSTGGRVDNYWHGKRPSGTKRGLTLPTATAHSGPITSGLEAQTKKLGALHPAFSCWLMGFPPEWESCAPLATPSSRRLQRKS